jgi:hypothetical protein
VTEGRVEGVACEEWLFSVMVANEARVQCSSSQQGDVAWRTWALSMSCGKQCILGEDARQFVVRKGHVCGIQNCAQHAASLSSAVPHARSIPYGGMHATAVPRGRSRAVAAVPMAVKAPRDSGVVTPLHVGLLLQIGVTPVHMQYLMAAPLQSLYSRATHGCCCRLGTLPCTRQL